MNQLDHRDSAVSYQFDLHLWWDDQTQRDQLERGGVLDLILCGSLESRFAGLAVGLVVGLVVNSIAPEPCCRQLGDKRLVYARI